MKDFAKLLYMLFFHPAITVYFRLFRGAKKLLILRNLQMNHLKYCKFKENVRLGHSVRLAFYPTFEEGRYSPYLEIGNNAYIGNHFTVFSADLVVIEDDVLIASYVTIASDNHSIDPESNLPYKNQPLSTAPVRIGAGSWIGEKAVILPGVTVGKRAIIGAGSIVTKDVPDYAIVAGNPAKILKVYDFEQHCWVRK